MSLIVIVTVYICHVILCVSCRFTAHVWHRLNCAAASVHTGGDFYKPFGMGYAEVQASDTQGYDIMKHYVSRPLSDEHGLEIDLDGGKTT